MPSVISDSTQDLFAMLEEEALNDRIDEPSPKPKTKRSKAESAGLVSHENRAESGNLGTLGSKNDTFSMPDLEEVQPDNQLTPDYQFCATGDFSLNNVPNVPMFPSLDLLAEAVDPVVEIEAEKQATIKSAKEVIDRVLLVCGDNPGTVFSSESLQALKIIYGNPQLKAEYRPKLKKALPSGVLLSDIDSQVLPAQGGSDNSSNDSSASELVAMVIDNGELFFDDQADKAYVSADIDGVIHTLAIGSKPFVEWASYNYYRSTKTGSTNGKSASESAIKQAGFVLAGIAKHDGQKQRVYLRVADHNGCYYIFIGDEQLRVIEVSATGWRILNDSPVKFWKPASMQPLPIPQVGGDLSLLWQFVNIPEADRPLVLAWLLESLRSETPKPILALTGTQGSAKSSTQGKIRQLIDNNSVNLRAAPKAIEDVFVSAGCNWFLSLENLSHLTANMQDALCTLATGGGFVARTLYTNNDETIIEVKRPVIINSIPNVITAQDLNDRAISIELPRIEYREESELNQKWEQSKPAIMGGLLDLFVETLAQLPKVKLDRPPRMADFTRLGEAMMQSQGNEAGVFDALYKANRAEGIGRALESSPVAMAVCEMVDDYPGVSSTVFHGTVKDLLTKLTDKYRHDSDGWPKSPRGLPGILQRQLPALETMGIEIVLGRKSQRIGKSQGIPITVKKWEHGNIGNIVLKNSAPQSKTGNLGSAAFDDAETF